MMNDAQGISGRIAANFYRSRLTPLLAIAGLLLGIVAALITPREEEPQIDVTMANVFVPFPGAAVADVENLATVPMEQVLAEIDDVDHIYSVSRPGMAVLTVQFEVGIPRTEALVRLYNAIYSNLDWRPADLGLGPVIVKPRSIDDVPIVNLTLWTADPARGAFDLRQIAHALEAELQRIPGTRDIETIGGPEQTARILLDPLRLAARNIALQELRQALSASNAAEHAGAVIADNKYVPVQAGQFLSSAEELAQLVIGMHEGRPVYLQDVADIEYGPAENTRYVWQAQPGGMPWAPAVTLAISKKPGENAVAIAAAILDRLERLRGAFIPEGVEVSVTRNYGATANEKANHLIQKLAFATVSVVMLVLFTLGRREAIVVGAAVVLTLAVTLFASRAWGFTLNRVSLFALIFSIGILVDDAIVVVENIHRHRRRDGRPLLESIPAAVDEVGGPTILATLTVIAALLPMAFVTGLMGPYMSPIPINASMGMLISLIVAFTFTPWLSLKLLGKGANHTEAGGDRLQRVFAAIMNPFLGLGNRRNRILLAIALCLLILLTCLLPVFKLVVLKMLPFDNKSEIQVVVDLPEGSPVEETNRALADLAGYLLTVPEVRDVQGYAGTAAPIGFNGLVRQYYLRQEAHLGELQVNLHDKKDRARSSHAIALALRPALAEIGARFGAAIKVVEVPPGPPVQAPLVAEVYGPDYPGQVRVARELKGHFSATAGVVDIDDSVEAEAERLVVAVDRQRAARLGIAQADIASAIGAALGGIDAGYLHTGHAKYPVPIRLELPTAGKGDINALLSMKLRSRAGGLVPMSELVTIRSDRRETAIHHKDLLPVVYVTGDVAGGTDSPLYGMFAILAATGGELEQFFIRQPDQPLDYGVKWDGEWQITYETFRDMGAAYAVGLVLIYLLVVAQFGSYLVPLVIMTPIAFTLIGILPGHALLGAQFTATSMIGMIALAGIIVRNSILLVDFMNHALAAGMPLEQAVIEAASVRAKPIVLTAAAAMLGALFILDDPIFNGLAVSLIFGLLVSTLLTLVIIPLLYYSLLRRRGDDGG
ncbi:MAG: efflux RND transporter permease subunit [Gammaproteobacteria bacterium]|nr:MAG: efflux RND transporter permease subunit [Gammaproteobacteria bacterium]